MTPEQVAQLAALRAQLAAVVAKVEASGRRMVALGERAARAERRAPERRAIRKAVRSLRSTLGVPRPRATSWCVPDHHDGHTAQRAATSPITPGAP